jgi:hypothetical protein
MKVCYLELDAEATIKVESNILEVERLKTKSDKDRKNMSHILPIQQHLILKSMKWIKC